MANFDKFAEKLLIVLEGGSKFVNLPQDKGGPTKYGVILNTWKQYGYDKDKDGDVDVEDLKLISINDAKYIAKKIFWDYFDADHIKNQSIAELIADWGYHSGRTTAARRVQRVLQVPVDGQFGHQTLKAINQAKQQPLFDAIKKDRKEFIEYLVKVDPTQQVFYKGWMNRINKFFFIEGLNDTLG